MAACKMNKCLRASRLYGGLSPELLVLFSPFVLVPSMKHTDSKTSYLPNHC